ncbi:hypothetical protein NKH77_32100 [Streptomyces sp. M19]
MDELFHPDDARLLPGRTTTGTRATCNPAARAATCGNVPTSSRPRCSLTGPRCWVTRVRLSPATTSPSPNCAVWHGGWSSPWPPPSSSRRAVADAYDHIPRAVPHRHSPRRPRRRRPAVDPHVPPRVVRIVVTRNGGRLLILSSGGVHPLRPQDTAYILRTHRFGDGP